MGQPFLIHGRLNYGVHFAVHQALFGYMGMGIILRLFWHSFMVKSYVVVV